MSSLVLYINTTRCRGKYQHIISQHPNAVCIVIYSEQSERVRVISNGNQGNISSFIMNWYKAKCKLIFKDHPKAKWICGYV